MGLLRLRVLIAFDAGLDSPPGKGYPTVMTALWMRILKEALPVIVDTTRNLYSSRYSRRPGPQETPQAAQEIGPLERFVQHHSQEIDRLSAQVETLRSNTIQLSTVLGRLFWLALAALILASLALILILLK